MNSFATSVVANGDATLTITGDWSMREGLPSLVPVRKMLVGEPPLHRVAFEAEALGKWDSALLTFLISTSTLCRERGVSVDLAALPPGVRSLLDLAAATGRVGGAEQKAPPSFVTRLGSAILQEGKGLGGSVRFLGESIIAFFSLLRGRARYRPTDLFVTIQECGAQALPIVSVISLLVGMIFAFVGAVQLKQFGADIYDANLVAVAMAREMAAVMTGIVLAGRTGAAFAAHIGAMQGNEEIDALSTIGISPVEFLVLPRMLALILMTPLLCIYANFMGILGGFIVGISTLNVTATAYLLQTQGAVTLGDFTIGIVKAAVFGALIAVTGCLRGIECGRSAAAVGTAATSAVVSGILAIIIIDAIFAVMLNFLGL
jgi:phospholipid/cholesterol/gamma-HCH transport system permease protein